MRVCDRLTRSRALAGLPGAPTRVGLTARRLPVSACLSYLAALFEQIDFFFLFTSLAVLLFSLTVHEAAHAWTAYRLGDPTARMLGRVSLNPAVHVDPLGTIVLPLISMVTGAPLLGWAKPVPVDFRYLKNPRRDFMVIASAGPMSNLVLAVIAAAILRLTPLGGGIRGHRHRLAGRGPRLTALRVNVLLALFNMIPVPPLDGGNVLGGILPAHLADRFDALRPYGVFILYGLMLTGVLGMVIGPPYSLILSVLL